MNASMQGWVSGLLGVVIFSGSLPATRAAVSGFSPLFLTSARALIAAVLAGMLLVLWRQARPQRVDMIPLSIVALGVVVGFPLLTALALQQMSAARSVVFIGLLPLATAIFAVWRGGEQPKPLFWVFSGMGSVTIALFAMTGDIASSSWADLLMVVAILVCGLGYAEGAKLSRRLGGWQVISWALLLSAPFMLLLTGLTWPQGGSDISLPAWLGLAYVSVFSMLIGFVFWYRGLAMGGTASVGQLQLLQPFLGLMLAAALLHEPIAWSMLLATGAVVVCVVLARRFA